MGMKLFLPNVPGKHILGKGSKKGSMPEMKFPFAHAIRIMQREIKGSIRKTGRLYQMNRFTLASSARSR